MLILATLLDNPGEPLPETRYRDPKHLVELGYNGLVLYETAGLSGIGPVENLGTGEMRRWVEHQFDQVSETIEKARAAGMAVYISYDALCLARSIVERDVTRIACKNQPTVLCPASDAALEHATKGLEQMMLRLPAVDGVVLRFGDNDAGRMPFLFGNDIYVPHCPRCSALTRADRVVRLIEAFHRTVVEGHDKRLIVRAWNVRPHGMHDTPELCREIAQRLPGDADDDRLVLSFKFSETDFWRYQHWNPASLTVGKRPIIYELQCQREFEGKGGIPNWQVPLWRDGPPEAPETPEALKADAKEAASAGLATLGKSVNVQGLWAWVRGGGWGGPFVKNERWIDANVVAVPMLAKNHATPLDTLADAWIHGRLQVESGDTRDALLGVLTHSPQHVVKSFYIGPYARRQKSAWHPNGDWIQDDLLDARAAWRIIQNLDDAELDQAVQEKHEACHQISEDRAALQRSMKSGDKSQIDPLVCSMMYTESLYETMRDLIHGLVAYRRFRRSKDPSQAELCKQRLLAAQSHWNHHTQRHATLPGAATAFREENFWDLTQQFLSELM